MVATVIGGDMQSCGGVQVRLGKGRGDVAGGGEGFVTWGVVRVFFFPF